MCMPKVVERVCRDYRIALADVRGYAVNRDYVRVLLRGGGSIKVNLLPGFDQVESVAEGAEVKPC